MQIILVSAWFQLTSGQAAIHGPSLPLVAPLTDGKMITPPLALGKWYGHVSGVEAFENKTLEKVKFDLVLLPAFTITEDNVRAARKTLSLDPVYVVGIDLPAEAADEERKLSIMTENPFAMSMDIPIGSRRLQFVCPKGIFHFALFAPLGKKIDGRTLVLSGPERWERMSFGH